MKADIGWCCHHRVNVCCRQDTESASLQSSGAAQLAGGVRLPSTIGRWMERDVGDAGTVSSRLVVIGISWRGAFKVFLELLQRQGLQQSRNVQSGQGTSRDPDSGMHLKYSVACGGLVWTNSSLVLD